MLIPLLVAALFLVMACFLLRGKGSWLIAGYNTMSQAEKRRYDEKKLCRAGGVFMLIVALGITALALCSMLVEADKLSSRTEAAVHVVFVVLVCLGAGVLIWFTNTKCRR